MGRMRLFVVLWATASLLLNLAGCGDSGTEGSVRIVAAAQEAAEEVGTARFRFESSSGRDVELVAKGSGAVDFEKQRLRLGVQVPGTEGPELRTILDDVHGYLFVPESRRDRTNGRAWVRFPVSAEERLQFNPQSVLIQLDRMEAEGVEVEEVGDDTVDGIETTHYRLTKEREVRTGPEGSTREQGSFEADLWLTAERVPVRARWSSGLSDFVMEGTFHMFDLGEPVQIEIPNEDDLAEAESAEAARELVFGNGAADEGFTTTTVASGLHN